MPRQRRHVPRRPLTSATSASSAPLAVPMATPMSHSMFLAMEALVDMVTDAHPHARGPDPGVRPAGRQRHSAERVSILRVPGLRPADAAWSRRGSRGRPRRRRSDSSSSDEDEDENEIVARISLESLLEDRALDPSQSPATAHEIAQLPERVLPPAPGGETGNTSASTGTSTSVGSGSGGCTASAAVCSVCLETPVGGERVTTLPCFHVFHSHCIRPWLATNSTCPLCKTSIRVQPPIHPAGASASSSSSSTSAPARAAGAVPDIVILDSTFLVT